MAVSRPAVTTEDASAALRRVHIVQERVLATVKLLAAAAGTVILFAFDGPADAVSPPDALVLPAYVLLALSGAATLVGLHHRTQAHLRTIQLGAMLSETVIVLSLALLHAGLDHAATVLVLVLLPLAGAARFGAAGALALGGVLLIEPFLRHLVRRDVLGLDSDLGASVVLLVPVLIAATIAAILAWSVGQQARSAVGAYAVSDRLRRRAEATNHITSAGLQDLGAHSLDGLADAIAEELGLPTLAVLRYDEDGFSMVSAHGLDPLAFADGVTVDADGPLDVAVRERRTVVQRGVELQGVRLAADTSEAVVVAPVIGRSVLRGAVVVESPHPEGITPRLVDDLEDVARHVGLLFEAQLVFEDQARRTRRYRDLEAASHRIITIASHELRTPLTSILGFAELLVDRDRELDADRRRQLASAMLRGSKRMTALLEDLNRMHTLERGQVLSAMGSVDIASVVAGLAEREGWPDRVHVVGERDLSARLDPELLGEVIVKLVDNALRHGDPPVTVRWYVTGRWLHVRVEDHGPGLPEGRVDEMFAPWTQRTELLAHAVGGGLGLPIARGLAEAMNGRLVYDDRIEGICAFELTVPLEPERVAPRPEPATDLAALGPVPIEDDPSWSQVHG